MSDHAKLIWPNDAEASQAKAIADRAGPECSFVVRALIQRCRELEAARCYHEAEASELAEKLRHSEFLRNAPVWNGLARAKVEAAVDSLFITSAGELAKDYLPMNRIAARNLVCEHLGLKDEL